MLYSTLSQEERWTKPAIRKAGAASQQQRHFSGSGSFAPLKSPPGRKPSPQVSAKDRLEARDRRSSGQGWVYQSPPFQRWERHEQGRESRNPTWRAKGRRVNVKPCRSSQPGEIIPATITDMSHTHVWLLTHRVFSTQGRMNLTRRLGDVQVPYPNRSSKEHYATGRWR